MASLNYPYTFTNGTTADANQVMSDLNAVKTFVEGSVVQTDGSVQAPTAAIANGAVTTAKLAAEAKPGLVHLTTVTMSNEATKSLPNIFSSTYQSYKIVLSNFTSANPVNDLMSVYLSLASGGTPLHGPYYSQTRQIYAFNSDTSLAGKGFGGTGNSGPLILGDAPSGLPGMYEGHFWSEIDINMPYDASTFTFGRQTTLFTNGGFGDWSYNFCYKQASSVDGIIINHGYAAGNTLSGTISVYGWKL